MPAPAGTTNGIARPQLTKTPGNPAYALAQVADILWSLTDPQELYDNIVETLKPFNPLGCLVSDEAATITALTDPDKLLLAVQAKKNPTMRRTATGMSVDNYRKMMDTLQQLLWNANSRGAALLNLQRYVVNFLLAADGLSTIKDRDTSYQARPRARKNDWAMV